MLELSVVIPTFNRVDTLRYVVPSLLAQDVPSEWYEVLVADSLSTDGTAEYLAESARSAANVRHLPGPYSGRAMARNAGIEAARAPLVVFTDADIIASPDLLRRHLDAHRARRRVAVVGCELQVKSHEDYVAQRDNEALRKPLHPRNRKRLSWLYFLTGNASVRRDDLERAGGFDESFTGYGHEDLELGYRLQQLGLEIVYEPRAINYHWHPVSYAEQKGRMELAGRSTVRFHRKHPHFAVRAKLGMTPVSLVLHSLLARNRRLLRWFERRAELEEAGRRGSRFNRDLVQQFHYVSGIKAALREPAAT